MKHFLFLSFLCLPLVAQQVDITVHAQVPLNQMSLNPTAGNDIWGFTDATGRDYAIMGLRNGTAIFDISNPAAPVEVGSVAGPNSTWRDIKTYVYDNTPGSFSAYAFVTTEANAGLQIIDLSQVPNSISLAATYTGNGLSTAHNIFISPDSGATPYAYILGSNLANGGVLILDISNPLTPVEVGRWTSFYTHDFYLGTHWADPNYDGREIGIAFCGSNNLSIIDFSDKANPQTLDNFVYPNISYSHSGWVTGDGRYLYACDELDEQQLGLNTSIYILDILDLTVPSLVNTWVGPTRAIDHNAFVKDSYLHISNYTRGYTLLDLADPLNPVEVGNTDTFPLNDGANFNGVWGVFPYFDSGLVVISDQSAGLFVLEPELIPGFRFSVDTDNVAACQGQSGSYQVTTFPMAGFTGQITFSLAGLPQGVIPVYSANPVTPGDSFSLTLNTSGTTPAGNYSLTLTGQAAGAEDRSLSLNLEVQEGADLAPGLLLPMDGANCIGTTQIHFSWNDLGGNRTYRLEIAQDLQFSNLVFSQEVDSSSLNLEEVLTMDEVHYWRVKAINNCGESDWSQIRSFRTTTPPILLVDDDDNSPDVRGYYTDLLDGMGLQYDFFEVSTSAGDGPNLATMNRYQWIIWFSGDKYGTPPSSGPNVTDEIFLAQYLDGGGHLFLSAQDYRHDMGAVSPFMSNYLGVSSIQNDSGSYTSVNGLGSFASFGSFNLSPTVGSEFFDVFTAGTGELVMEGNNNQGAAIRTGNTLFVAFTFATLINLNPEKAADILNFLADEYSITNCLDLNSPCFLYDTNGDGFDLGDLQARAALWEPAGNSETSLLGLISLSSCL